jgi:hypothetical protein
MSSTTNLRSRRSAAQLHALEGVEREIRAQDSHNRRKYLREFNQAYRSYESRSRFASDSRALCTPPVSSLSAITTRCPPRSAMPHR